MNEALRLQISAYVDGELPENETELLMRRLSQDAALRELVAGYLRIGRAVRQDREIPGIDQLRGRIQAALGEQPAETPVPVAAPANRYLRPVAGLAVASVVAAVALLGLRQVEPPLEQPAEAGASVAASPGYTEPQPAEVLINQPSELLRQYYLSHDATARDLGANGILTRLVTLELREVDNARREPAATTPVDDAETDEAPADAPPPSADRDR